MSVAMPAARSLRSNYTTTLSRGSQVDSCSHVKEPIHHTPINLLTFDGTNSLAWPILIAFLTTVMAGGR